MSTYVYMNVSVSTYVIHILHTCAWYMHMLIYINSFAHVYVYMNWFTKILCVCVRAKCLHQCLAHAMLLSYHTLPHSVLKSDWIGFGPTVHHDFSVSLYLLPSWPGIASYPPALTTQVRLRPLGCLGSPSLHLVVCNFPQPITTPCTPFLSTAINDCELPEGRVCVSLLCILHRAQCPGSSNALEIFAEQMQTIKMIYRQGLYIHLYMWANDPCGGPGWSIGEEGGPWYEGRSSSISEGRVGWKGQC